METIFDGGLIWWITVIEIPIISTLFYLILRVRSMNDTCINELRYALELRTNKLKDSLSAFKLETARTYAVIGDLKDVESRIIDHLLRIEEKLDKTAMKAEVLEATHKNTKERNT
ncbi:MAG: hypothetical protein AAF244_03415 [Pseudomonadota bacterium]